MELNTNQFAKAIWERLPEAEITAEKEEDGIKFEISYKGKTVKTRSLVGDKRMLIGADQAVTTLFFMLHPNKSYKAKIPKTF